MLLERSRSASLVSHFTDFTGFIPKWIKLIFVSKLQHPIMTNLLRLAGQL